MGSKRSSDLSVSIGLAALLLLLTAIANYPITSLVIGIAIAAAWLSYYFLDRNKKLSTYDMSEVDQMSGHEFEEFVCSIFISLGYHAEVTQKSRDFGVDVICKHGRDKIALQTKRYSKNVNLKCVQEVTAGMRRYNCNKSMVVTNSYFTPSAIELAKHNDCELVDRDGLINLIQQSARLSARMADTPDEDERIEPITGKELLTKIKELGQIDKTDIAIACGYSKTNSNGKRIVDFTAFYNALLDAKNARDVDFARPPSRVITSCHSCGRSLSLPEGKSGRVKCPVCGTDFYAKT